MLSAHGCVRSAVKNAKWNMGQQLFVWAQVSVSSASGAQLDDHIGIACAPCAY